MSPNLDRDEKVVISVGILICLSLVISTVYIVLITIPRNERIKLKRVYDKGRQANQLDVPAEANPHTLPRYSTVWLDGWMSENKRGQQ